MKALAAKYAAKAAGAHLADVGDVLVGGMDAELEWNRPDPACAVLEEVLAGLNVNALLFARPAEPYRTVLDFLAGRSTGAVRPSDCESRTLMHDLPVVENFAAAPLTAALRKRKSVIVLGKGVVTWGAVSPEQAFIFFSSVCFAAYVKFFADYLANARAGRLDQAQRTAFAQVIAATPPYPGKPPVLMQGPFEDDATALRALAEAGRATVNYGLVDSFFGNVSYRLGQTLFISQTGSSLDELEGCIDPCALDGSSCAAITASSEFTAHRDIVLRTGKNAVLHGHPKFSVILSMDCTKKDCTHEGQCHIRCPEPRFIADIPVVPGEVGTGPYGLCHTLPPAIEGRRGAIVYGHGLFTTGQDDFNEAFLYLLEGERLCQEEYFRRLAACGESVA